MKDILQDKVENHKIRYWFIEDFHHKSTNAVLTYTFIISLHENRLTKPTFFQNCSPNFVRLLDCISNEQIVQKITLECIFRRSYFGWWLSIFHAYFLSSFSINLVKTPISHHVQHHGGSHAANDSFDLTKCVNENIWPQGLFASASRI